MLRADRVVLRADRVVLRSDFTVLWADRVVLRSDFTVLWPNRVVLRSGLAVLRANRVVLRPDFAVRRSELAVLRPQRGALRSNRGVRRAKHARFASLLARRAVVRLGRDMKQARWLVDAAKLSARRIARGMTCAELARRAGVSERTLGRYESGAAKLADIEQLRAVARVLHVPVEGIARPSEPAPPGPALPPGAPSPYAMPQERARLLASTQLESIVALEASLPPPRPVTHGGEPVPVLTARKLQNVFSAFATYEGERFAVIGRVAKQRGASPLEAKMIGSRHGVAVRFLLVRAVTDAVDIQVTVHTAAARETRALQRVFEEEREACAIVKVRVAPDEVRSEEKGFDFFLSPKPLPWALVVEAIA